MMENPHLREVFSQPKNLYQRRYEALRAVFLEERSQKEVALAFGFPYQSFRQLVYEFRQQSQQAPDASLFFANQASGDPRV
jgi:DNA-directed RNA polymerase specialized sigma24 family protein